MHGAISDLSCHTNFNLFIYLFIYLIVGLEKEAAEPREPNHAILANLRSLQNKQAAHFCSLLPAWILCSGVQCIAWWC